MKQVSVLASLLIFVLFLTHHNGYAQDRLRQKNFKLSAGVMFVPQGIISLKNIEAGTSTIMSLYMVTPVSNGVWTFIPFYDFDQALGLETGMSLSQNHEIYIIGSKHVNRNGGYVGFGTKTPVAKHLAFWFVEFGATTGHHFETHILSGVFIPLTRNFTSKTSNNAH